MGDNKDIFSMLIEQEMQSENPNPCLVKFGELFLSRLSLIGTQLETLLLTSEVEKMDAPVLAVESAEYFRKVEKGVKVLDLVTEQLLQSSQPTGTNVDIVATKKIQQ